MSRRFSLGRALASENWNEEEYPTQISAEEAEVMNQEAIDLANEINEDNKEVAAMIDKADSLEDMVVVADSIEGEPTEGEVNMAQIVGDMAAAGDDEVTGDDVVQVAAESGAPRSIAVEGLKETIANIWEGIKKWLKEIWKKLEQYFYKVFGNVPRLRKEVEAMRKRADQVDEEGKVIKNENNTFELTAGLDSLKAGQNVTAKWSDTKAAFDTSKKAVEIFSKAGALSGVGKDLKEAVDKYDASNVDSINEVVKALYNGKTLKLSVIDGTPTTDKDFDVTKIANLLGGRDLVESVRKVKDNVSDVELLDKVRSFKVRFETSGNNKSVKKDSVKYTTMKTDEVLAACDACDGMLDALEEFHRGKAKKEMLKYASEIEKACDKVSKESGSIDNENATTKAQLVSNARAVYRLATVYASLSSTLVNQLYAHSLANVRTVLMVCSRSLSAHTKPE